VKETVIFILILFIPTILFSQESNLNKFFEYFMNNDFENARSYLEQNIKADPENKELHFYLGKTFLVLKKYQQAKKEFGLALKNGYSPEHILKYLGQIYEDQGMLAEAIERYQVVMRLEPKSVRLKLKLASLYYRQQNYFRSISLLRKFLSQDSTNLQGYYLMGRAYLRTEKYDSALTIASKALELDSTHVPNLLNLGIASFEKGKLDTAANSLEKAKQLSPKSDEAKYYLAKTYARSNRLPDAIGLLEECHKLTGKYRLKALKSLVQFYHKIDSLEASISTAKKYLKEKPEEPLVHHFYARALSDKNEFNKANEEFIKAIQFSNQDFISMTYFYRGLNYYYQEKYDKAIKWYKKVITIDPGFSFAYYNLAVAYDMYYEDKSSAIRYYKKFLELAEGGNADSVTIIAAQMRLKELKEKAFFKRGK